MSTFRKQMKTAAQASRLRAGALALLLFLSLAGCNKEEPYDPPVTEPVRTLLFYMGGDNNLSSEVNAKIEKLLAVPLAPGCRVLVFADTKDGNPQLLEILSSKNGNTLDVVHDYPECNSASAKVFGTVLRQVRELCPAPSYGLVLFSHASGWLPEGTYNNPALRSGSSGQGSTRSIIQDGSDEMEIPAFAAAIPEGMLDFIIFEACHMAGVEVAWELKNKTDYIVASSAEIVSPGFARCYTDALPHLFKKTADLQGFCRAVETDYATRSGDYASLTLSLIDTKGLDALADAVRSIGAPQDDRVNAQSFDRYGGNLFFDLQDSFKEATADQQAVLRSAIDRCVLWKAATAAFMPAYGGFGIEAHCGLTIYIPQERYPRLNAAYKSLSWYRAVISNNYCS